MQQKGWKENPDCDQGSLSASSYIIMVMFNHVVQSLQPCDTFAGKTSLAAHQGPHLIQHPPSHFQSTTQQWPYLSERATKTLRATTKPTFRNRPSYAQHPKKQTDELR